MSGSKESARNGDPSESTSSLDSGLASDGGGGAGATQAAARIGGERSMTGSYSSTRAGAVGEPTQ